MTNTPGSCGCRLSGYQGEAVMRPHQRVEVGGASYWIVLCPLHAHAPAMQKLISLTCRTLNDRLGVITDEAAHDVLTDIRDCARALLTEIGP